MTDLAARILFVDDEPQVLRGLERMLRPMRDRWSLYFETSAAEALQRLDREPIDMLVTDLRIPGLDGAQLLEAVAERHPSVLRVVLSGHADDEMMVASAALAHQLLAKPFDGPALCARLGQTLSMRGLLQDAALLALVARLRRLPSLPSLYLDIVAELNQDYPSIQRVAAIVSRDMGMTAKLLQLVNSAIFALHQDVTDPAAAVRVLGLDTIRSLALSAHIFARYEGRARGFDVAALWAHAIRVSELARTLLARADRPAALVGDATTAGLLHDVGKLILADGLDEYARVLAEATRTGRPVHHVEQERLGTTHAHVGAYLLGIWGLPEVIVEAVARHHAPDRTTSVGPAAAVTLADRLVACGGLDRLSPEDARWLDGLDVPDWRTRWSGC